MDPSVNSISVEKCQQELQKFTNPSIFLPAFNHNDSGPLSSSHKAQDPQSSCPETKHVNGQGSRNWNGIGVAEPDPADRIAVLHGVYMWSLGNTTHFITHLSSIATGS